MPAIRLFSRSTGVGGAAAGAGVGIAGAGAGASGSPAKSPNSSSSAGAVGAASAKSPKSSAAGADAAGGVKPCMRGGGSASRAVATSVAWLSARLHCASDMQRIATKNWSGWCGGVVVGSRWRCGAVARWRRGAVAPWRGGAVARRLTPSLPLPLPGAHRDGPRAPKPAGVYRHLAASGGRTRRPPALR